MLQGNLMMLMASGLALPDKLEQAKRMNRLANGALFSGSPIPHNFHNQRQKRKRTRWANGYSRR